MRAFHDSAPRRRLGIAELEQRLGYERTTIARWYRAGRFPAPHYLGKLRLWWLDEVEAWEQAHLRPAARR